MSESFLDSECVSCGACVQACPTATLTEKALIEIGQPEHSVVTTCAYCGVGCSFKAEMRGEEVVRMVPYKDGKANRGHSCVKGRFAWGYATHKERILKPMVRDKITDPWRETTWEEAIGRVASEFKRIQDQYGRDAVGGITSSRCTNEETFLVQKLIRAGFGVNNVDTCARVCHSPTGYGLKTAFGTSRRHAGLRLGRAHRRDDGDRRQPDRRPPGVRQPHEEAAARGRQADRRRSAPHRPGAHAARRGRLPPAADARHQRRRADRRWRTSSSPRAWSTRPSCASAATGRTSRSGPRSSSEPRALARGDRPSTPASIRPSCAAAARLYATGGNAAIYYGLGVTEHSQGSTTVMAIANLAMATGNLGRPGVGVNPLRGQNNVQGACDMGSFPHELSGYRHISDDATRAMFEALWGRPLNPEPGLRIPNMLDAAVDGTFKAIYIQGEDILQSDPNTHARRGRPRGDGMRGGAGPVPERDRQLRARVPAGLHLPGEGRHLHQRRAAHPARAPGDDARATAATPTGRSRS